MIKNEWTLAEINALPAGEHDFFDRKSGRLLADPQFRNDLAKAFSGIANSGGGHIILGVADDGTLDGVPPLKGRTCVREWIEQIIPNLVEPVPTAFRVHRLEATTDYSIPADGIVVVIDIGDSHLAPFQSRQNKLYYYRVGGHSLPAPHFYLDAVRKRKVAPVFKTELTGARLIRAVSTDSNLFVQLIIDLTVTNEGNVTPTHWHVDLRYNDVRVANEGPVRRSNFPAFTLRYLDGYRVHNNPVLPGQSRSVSEIVGLFASESDRPHDSLPSAINALFNPDNTMSASVVTESHIGDWSPLDISQLHSIVTADEIRRFIPEITSAKQDGSLGGGINSFGFSIEDFDEPDDHARFSGVIENTSEELFKDFTIVVAFFDENENPTGHTACEVGYLPPGVRRPWNGWIVAAEIWAAKSVKLFYYDKKWIEA